MLELAVLIPGTLLAYLPMKQHLKIKMGALTAIWLSTLLMLCIVGGLFCYSFEIKTISNPACLYAYDHCLLRNA